MKRSIKRNALLNGLKQCITLVYGLITIPYVSRILGNENYGKINFGSSIISYFTMIAALGISTYAVREGAGKRDNKKKLTEFSNEVFTINILSTIVSYTLFFILLAEWQRIRDYRIQMLIQVAPILFITLGVDWINIIYEDYLYITIRYIIVHIISVVLLFLFVKSADDYLKYVGLISMTSIMANVTNIFYIKKRYLYPKLVFKANYRKHIVPLTILFFNTLTISIYVESDKTILTIFETDAVTGVYSIAVSIYTIIKTFMNAVLSVSLPRVSSYVAGNRCKDYEELLHRLLHAIFVFLLPAIAGLFTLSPQIIFLVAGKDYLGATWALRILSFALLFGSIAYFLVYAILIPFKKEKYCFFTTVLSAILNVTLNIFLIPRISLNGAAATTLISESLVVGLSILFAHKIISFVPNAKSLIPSIIGTSLVWVVCSIISRLVQSVTWCLIISISISIIAYSLCLLIFRDPLVWATVKNGIKMKGKK